MKSDGIILLLPIANLCQLHGLEGKNTQVSASSFSIVKILLRQLVLLNRDLSMDTGSDTGLFTELPAIWSA